MLIVKWLARFLHPLCKFDAKKLSKNKLKPKLLDVKNVDWLDVFVDSRKSQKIQALAKKQAKIMPTLLVVKENPSPVILFKFFLGMRFAAFSILKSVVFQIRR
jgi:hypothetical protein